MGAFMRDDVLFSNPIDFLDDAAYVEMLDKMFQKEEKQGKHHSEEQLARYYEAWAVPKQKTKQKEKSTGSSLNVLSSLTVRSSNNNQILTILIVVGSVCIAMLICMIVVCHCNKERKQRSKWGEYAKYHLLHKQDEAGYRTFPN